MAAEQGSTEMKMFIGLMKYDYFLMTFLEMFIFLANMHSLMIFWVQICSKSLYYIVFTIIIAMLQLDYIMQFLILHCFYICFLNHYFIVQICNLMNMLIFRWFYDHHWMFLHMTFMTLLLLNLPTCRGAL